MYSSCYIVRKTVSKVNCLDFFFQIFFFRTKLSRCHQQKLFTTGKLTKSTMKWKQKLYEYSLITVISTYKQLLAYFTTWTIIKELSRRFVDIQSTSTNTFSTSFTSKVVLAYDGSTSKLGWIFLGHSTNRKFPIGIIRGIFWSRKWVIPK